MRYVSTTCTHVLHTALVWMAVQGEKKPGPFSKVCYLYTLSSNVWPTLYTTSTTSKRGKQCAGTSWCHDEVQLIGQWSLIGQILAANHRLHSRCRSTLVAETGVVALTTRQRCDVVLSNSAGVLANRRDTRRWMSVYLADVHHRHICRKTRNTGCK